MEFLTKPFTSLMTTANSFTSLSLSFPGYKIEATINIRTGIFQYHIFILLKVNRLSEEYTEIDKQQWTGLQFPLVFIPFLKLICLTMDQRSKRRGHPNSPHLTPLPQVFTHFIKRMAYLLSILHETKLHCLDIKISEVLNKEWFIIFCLQSLL